MKEKIQRYVENGLEGTALSSPMDPPQAFHLEGIEKVPYAEMADPLRSLIDEHRAYVAVLDGLETALIDLKNRHWAMDEGLSKGFREFFHFIDEETVRHNAKEEKALFPILRKKLIAVGECSPGDKPSTAIDIMEDDHAKVMQSGCLVFNLLGIAARLKDAESRNTVFQIAYDQGREIIETMRLHIFKENEVLFPRAQKLLSANEMEYVGEMMNAIA